MTNDQVVLRLMDILENQDMDNYTRELIWDLINELRK